MDICLIEYVGKRSLLLVDWPAKGGDAKAFSETLKHTRSLFWLVCGGFGLSSETHFDLFFFDENLLFGLNRNFFSVVMD